MSVALLPVRSVPSTDFVAGLATNAVTPITNLIIPAPQVRRWYIRAISILGPEGIAPELNFFSSATGINADPTLDNWIGAVGLLATDAQQFAGAGLFRWWTDGLQFSYFDNDAMNAANPGINPALHVVLANRGAVAKTAGAPGALMATFWLEPLTGSI